LGLSHFFCRRQAAQTSFADIQQSHVTANVPPPEAFDPLLRCDLLAFFKHSTVPTATGVEYQLLRETSTQSGVAYPKYYLWVKILASSVVVQEGAARVAAIERKRFEITDFLAKSDVKAVPGTVGNVFPAALVRTVLSLAGAK
jgi:hypothetical protein